jgi:hypothetical protein
MRLEDDERLGGHPVERLPHRRRAHPQLERDLVDAESVPRRVGLIDDPFVP